MNNTKIIYSTEDYEIFESGFVVIDNPDMELKDVIRELVNNINDLEQKNYSLVTTVMVGGTENIWLKKLLKLKNTNKKITT